MTESAPPEGLDVLRLVSGLRATGRRLTANRSLRDIDLIMARIVEAAALLVPGVAGSGISQSEDGAIRASHGSSEDIARLDALQAELHDGPCITAIDDPPPSGIVLAPDLAGSSAAAWPRFAPLAVAAGYRSIMSIGLANRGPVRTALNLYASGPATFDRASEAPAAVFGLQAAALLEGAENAAHLGLALTTRGEIGQALGILIERHRESEPEAFERLSGLSQSLNVKLVDVARSLIKEVHRPGLL